MPSTGNHKLVANGYFQDAALDDRQAWGSVVRGYCDLGYVVKGTHNQTFEIICGADIRRPVNAGIEEVEEHSREFLTLLGMDRISLSHASTHDIAWPT